MKKLDLRLFRLIKNSKGQFIAITLLVIVGLIVYTALNMAAINLEDTVNYYYEETNFADIFVQLVRIPKLSLDKLRKVEGIEEYEGRIVYDVPMKTEDENEKVNIRMISMPEKISINTLYMVEGKGIQDKGKDVLIIEQFANGRNIKVGDKISLQIQGRVYDLNVKGIVASSEYIYVMENEQNFLPEPDKFGVVYVSEEFAMQSTGLKNSYNEILVKVKNNEASEEIIERIENELDRYGIKRIYDREDQLSNRMISEEIDGLKKSSSTVPMIFLGVAAIIIGAMLSRMVRNDRITIGILKALGYSNKDILLHYTKYSLAIGLVGSTIGILLGTVLQGFMTSLYTQFFNIPMLMFKFYYNYVLSGIIISITFCILAGIFGAKKVIKIVPAESMRPEAPKSGGKIFLDNMGLFWKKLSFSWKMVLRNIFRSKKRFIFITLGISMTYAITLMPITLQNDAFSQLIGEYYSEFQKMDYNINFSRPVESKITKEIKKIVDVDDIEPKIEYPFELVYGSKKKVANIVGVYPDTVFYQFSNTNGEKINLPKNGIVLSEGLAKYLGVKKGDKVKIETYIPGRDDVFIEVKDIIKQSLGINGYMSMDEMQKKLVDKNLITGVYLNSGDDVKEKLRDAKNISSIQSTEEMMGVYMEFLDLTIYSVSVMVIFAGILGFAIVYNSTIMSISERSLEFSSLRVMGFTKREIFNLITKENIVMTILGIIVGIPLGQYMLNSLENTFSTEIYTIEINPSINSFIVTVFMVVGFVLFAQLATLRKINRLDFIEALKNRIS